MPVLGGKGRGWRVEQEGEEDCLIFVVLANGNIRHVRKSVKVEVCKISPAKTASANRTRLMSTKKGRRKNGGSKTRKEEEMGGNERGQPRRKCVGRKGKSKKEVERFFRQEIQDGRQGTIVRKR